MEPIYEISVSRMLPDCYAYQQGNHYSLSTSKKIGDSLGGGTPIANKEELITDLKHMIKSWRGFDSILGRQVEPPDKRNTEVSVEVGLEKELISPSEIWTIIMQETKGIKDIRSFFG